MTTSPSRAAADLDRLRHETAALYRFVQNIRDYASKTGGPRVYSEAGHRFLNHIGEIADATLLFLDRFPAAAPADASLRSSYLQKLATLQSCWETFHKFVKPAADCDTMHFPLPLVEALSHQVRQLRGFARVHFAVFHTDELTYLQLNTGRLRGLSKRLVALVPTAKIFPHELGLIGIPYSASKAVFANCIIAHEIGHFVFQTSASENWRLSLDQAVELEIHAVFADITEPEWIDPIKVARECIRAWVQELFCDLFAVGLIGPAYSLAYVEFSRLHHLLEPEHNLSTSPADVNASHPSDHWRLDWQTQMLERLGWWPLVDGSTADAARALQRIRAPISGQPVPPINRANIDDLLFPKSQEAFRRIASALLKRVEELLEPIRPDTTRFEKLYLAIHPYLALGVVPSTIQFDGSDHFPDPVTLLNAGYKFYLESLPELISNVKDAKPESISERAYWGDKLELWIMKALEDYSLRNH